MNIILFLPEEVEHPLSRRDARAAHLLDVLHLLPGGKFDAGLINGPLGRGTLTAVGADSLTFIFEWKDPPPPLYPIHLVIGLPRPQTARDILRDATSQGVASIHFVRTERSEPSYARSRLWNSEEWRKCVINGATQAFCTRLPEVTHDRPLLAAITDLLPNGKKVALDNYESPISITELTLARGESVALAIGSERGWSAAERVLLRRTGFEFAHLGKRVLRTESACIAAVAVIRSKLGLL